MGSPETAPERKADAKPRAAAQIIDELKRARQREIEALADAAEEDPGMLDRLSARVQSLSTAIDTLGKATTETRDRRFTIAAVAVAVLLAGTLLLLHRSPAVLADTTASHVAFTVTRPYAPFRDAPRMAAVELAGLTRVRQEGVPDTTVPPDEDLLLRVQPNSESKNPGSMGLDSLVVPARTQIEMTHTGPGNTIRFRFLYPAGASSELDLDVVGDMVIRLNGQHRASFPAPARIAAVPTSNPQLIVQFREPQVTFPAPVPIESISWTTLVPSGGNLGSRVRHTLRETGAP
jgi:hypothetical protein